MFYVSINESSVFFYAVACDIYTHLLVIYYVHLHYIYMKPCILLNFLSIFFKKAFHLSFHKSIVKYIDCFSVQYLERKIFFCV